jgi:hypothetical protein
MCAVGRPTQKPHYPQLRPSAVPGRRRGTRHTTRCNDGHSHFTTCESNAHARWHVIWKTGRPPTAKGQSAQKQKPKGKGHPGTRAFLSRIAVLTPRTPNQPSGTASSHCLTPGYLFFRSAGCGLRAVGRLGRFVWVWGVGYYACACAINTCHAAFARFESNRKSEQSGRQSAIAKAKGAPGGPGGSHTPRPPPPSIPPPPPPMPLDLVLDLGSCRFIPMRPRANPMRPHAAPCQPHATPCQPHANPMRPHANPMQPHAPQMSPPSLPVISQLGHWGAL